MPFGEELGASVGGRTTGMGFSGSGDSNRKKFTGYQRDTESGLDYAQARYYGNTQGRFTSPDPFSGSATIADPQTFNRYQYCRNNPVNSVDPTGMATSTGSLINMNRADGSDYRWSSKSHGSWEQDRAEMEAAWEQQVADAFGNRGAGSATAAADWEMASGIADIGPGRFDGGSQTSGGSDRLQDAVIGYNGESSPGVDDRFNEGHYGPHALSPEHGGYARSLPSLSGTVVYWNYQELDDNKKPIKYTVRVRPPGANFYVNYEDLASVAPLITKHMKRGVFNEHSGVRLKAGQTFGTVLPWIVGDPQNRSKRGLHVEFVKTQFYVKWADNVAKHGTQNYGAISPTSWFINPCGGSGSPVTCH